MGGRTRGQKPWNINQYLISIWPKCQSRSQWISEGVKQNCLLDSNFRDCQYSENSNIWSFSNNWSHARNLSPKRPVSDARISLNVIIIIKFNMDSSIPKKIWFYLNYWRWPAAFEAERKFKSKFQKSQDCGAYRIDALPTAVHLPKYIFIFDHWFSLTFPTIHLEGPHQFWLFERKKWRWPFHKFYRNLFFFSTDMSASNFTLCGKAITTQLLNSHMFCFGKDVQYYSLSVTSLSSMSWCESRIFMSVMSQLLIMMLVTLLSCPGQLIMMLVAYWAVLDN